jgi:hypothetical protein
MFETEWEYEYISSCNIKLHKITEIYTSGNTCLDKVQMEKLIGKTQILLVL